MNELIDTAFQLEGKLIYKKLKNRYRIFCMKCQRYEYVTKEQFKQIQAAQICPMCYQQICPTTIMEHNFRKFIMDDKDDGYIVFVSFRFGCKPRTKVTHVCRYIGRNKVEVRYIFCNMGYGFCVNWDLKEWKTRYAQGYLYRFNSIHKPEEISGKKEYIYRSLGHRGYTDKDIDRMVKSNQKKIIIDNLMNARQMEYVLAFDLKSYDDLYKYRSYIKKNEPDARRPLNIYYLDYLKRKNIKLRDFYDYMKQCKELGFKLDKPTDFEHRHHVLSQMIYEKRNKETEENVKKRYVKMLKKAYSSGDIEILPFRDCEEIRKCGKTLHNCIASYINAYGRGNTDMYYLKKKKKILVAIEVENKKLIQARADHNKDCPPAYMKHINRWCKENRIIVGELQ